VLEEARSKLPQRITASHLALWNNGVGINLSFLNLCILVGTRITNMIRLGIRDNVYMLLNRLGWVDLLRPMKDFENFTYEFLISINSQKIG